MWSSSRCSSPTLRASLGTDLLLLLSDVREVEVVPLEELELECARETVESSSSNG